MSQVIVSQGHVDAIAELQASVVALDVGLVEITRRVHEHLNEAEVHLASAVDSAIAAGIELIKAKSAVKARQQAWLTYLEAAFPSYHVRTLQGYMRLARTAQDQEKRNAIRKLSLREALRSLSEGHRRTGGEYSDEWFSPQALVDLSLKMLGGIDVDPCWHPACLVKATQCFAKEQDGLKRSWNGRVYLNPPFQENQAWIEKLVEEFACGRATEAIVIVPNRSEAEWFTVLDRYPRCHLRGRVKFFREDDGPGKKWSSPFPCAAIYLGRRSELFASIFSTAGTVFGAMRIYVPGGTGFSG
jgi:hypothetical protein